MSLPYYKYHPTEELGNYQIMSLSHEALGVWYLLRIVQLWPHKCRIPDDPSYIAPLLKLSPDRWKELRTEFLDRGLIQVIDGCVTIASMREKWEGAKTYTEGQRERRLRDIEKKKEKERLKKEKKIAQKGSL